MRRYFPYDVGNSRNYMRPGFVFNKDYVYMSVNQFSLLMTLVL